MSENVYEVTDPHGISYQPKAGGSRATKANGETVDDLTDSAAAWLLANGAIVLKSEAVISKMSRADLNAAAAEAGVADPDKLPNREAVAQALAAAKEETSDA